MAKIKLVVFVLISHVAMLTELISMGYEDLDQAHNAPSSSVYLASGRALGQVMVCCGGWGGGEGGDRLVHTWREWG